MRTAQEHEQAARQAREQAAQEERTPEEKLKEKYGFAKARRVQELTQTLPRPLVKGVIYLGRRFMLTGGSKARKSFLLQQQVFCIGNGFPFIGFATTKVKVLYVNLELLVNIEGVDSSDIPTCFSILAMSEAERGLQARAGGRN
jgi:RecA-family ATPase